MRVVVEEVEVSCDDFSIREGWVAAALVMRG